MLLPCALDDEGNQLPHVDAVAIETAHEPPLPVETILDTALVTVHRTSTRTNVRP